jgi:hypothetical protein
VTGDLLELIRFELRRIAADVEGAGELDSIGVNDESGGWASLGASPGRHDFYWYGRQEVMLGRLRQLASGSGHLAVREGFRSRYPGFAG